MTKQEDSGHSFLAYFKRATSPLAVLRILSDRPMYGYELIQELKQRSGGKYQLSLLYPVLYRLEEQGYLEISSSEIVDGRARNYYAVTPAGRDYLRQTLAEYAEISGVFQQLMEDWDGYEAQDCASLDELIARVGTPDEAAQELLSGIAPERVHAYQKKRRWKYILAAAIIVLFVCCAALIYGQEMTDHSAAYAEEHIVILPATDLSGTEQ